MTERSARFDLPFLQAGQAQKEVFHNEALTRLDGLLHPAVAAIATASPPSAPMVGESWIVGQATDGAWAGMTGRLATWTAAGWRFFAPVIGMQVWLKDRGRWAWHDGAGWRDDGAPCAGLLVDGRKVVGQQCPALADPAGGQVVDMEARATISAILRAMESHGLIAT